MPILFSTARQAGNSEQKGVKNSKFRCFARRGYRYIQLGYETRRIDSPGLISTAFFNVPEILTNGSFRFLPPPEK